MNEIHGHVIQNILKKASLILNATQLNSNINCTFQNCTNDLLYCVLTLM